MGFSPSCIIQRQVWSVLQEVMRGEGHWEPPELIMSDSSGFSMTWHISGRIVMAVADSRLWIRTSSFSPLSENKYYTNLSSIPPANKLLYVTNFAIKLLSPLSFFASSTVSTLLSPSKLISSLTRMPNVCKQSCSST